MSLHIKRAYELPAKSDGLRILVDRVWPRGLSKKKLKLYRWEKELAPSTALRKWFAHDPAKWAGFKRRYSTELKKSPFQKYGNEPPMVEPTNIPPQMSDLLLIRK